MSQPWKLITERKEELKKCWLAATLSTKIFYKKFRKSVIDDIDLCQMSDHIKNIIRRDNHEEYGKCSLHVSSQLVYGIVKIFSYQTSNLEKEIINMMGNVSSYTIVKTRTEKKHYKKVQNPLDVSSICSAQLHEDVNLLPNEFDIDINFRNKMNDAACLDFGALTEQELSFINQSDVDISSLAFERTLLRTDNFEDRNLMMISPVYNDKFIIDEEHRISFTKTTPPEKTTPKMGSRKSDLLTPQKRYALEGKHIETPSKRRRLRFEDEPDIDEVTTISIPKTTVASTSATDQLSELPQNLELAQYSLLEIERKSRKKKVFADKNIKLSDKTIRKWINNTKSHIMPSNVINVNIPTTEVILKAPSTYYTSIYERKWNNSLSALFHMHTVTISKQQTEPVEHEELLEKSTELTRFENKDNKTEGLSELFSTLGKTLESSLHTKSAFDELDNSSVLQQKYYKERTNYDSHQEVLHPDRPNIIDEIALESLEQNLETLNIGQSICLDSKTYEEEKEEHQVASKLSEPCTLTKQELLALLEVHWRNTEMIRFTDVIQPDSYDKNDAVCCYVYLLELHKEKKITLEQRMPYDILWIKKY